jgi:hypothetical protein
MEERDSISEELTEGAQGASPGEEQGADVEAHKYKRDAVDDPEKTSDDDFEAHRYKRD